MSAAACGARFDAEELTATARRQAGLCDLGGDDFREPMRRLLASMHVEGGLSPSGREGIRRMVLRNLEQRLRIAALVAEHPEIRDVPIERPVFILGFPRTGTTLLHNLLAQDPAARPLLLWELLRPTPPPEPATRDSDGRIALAARALARVHGSVPDLLHIHPQAATSPDECFYLFAITFQDFIADIAAPCPSYLSWLRMHDVVDAYRYYRTILQILTWKVRGRYLVLKAPGHLFALDALLAVFPDARIVQAHRDVGPVAASTCSLWEHAQRLYTSVTDPAALGRHWLEHWGAAMDGAMAVRDRVGETRFHDVAFEELMADPLGAVRHIHARFGIESVRGTDERIAAWPFANPRDKHGVHRYSLSRYALDPDRLAERFSRYTARFGVAIGAQGSLA